METSTAVAISVQLLSVQFAGSVFYRTQSINTHVVNKLVLHLWSSSHSCLYVIIRYMFIIINTALFDVLLSSVSLLPDSYCSFPHDNPQSACTAVLSVPPYTTGFLIENTEHV